MKVKRKVQGLGPWRVWAEPSLPYLRTYGASPLVDPCGAASTFAHAAPQKTPCSGCIVIYNVLNVNDPGPHTPDPGLRRAPLGDSRGPGKPRPAPGPSQWPCRLDLCPPRQDGVSPRPPGPALARQQAPQAWQAPPRPPPRTASFSVRALSAPQLVAGSHRPAHRAVSPAGRDVPRPPGNPLLWSRPPPRPAACCARCAMPMASPSRRTSSSPRARSGPPRPSPHARRGAPVSPCLRATAPCQGTSSPPPAPGAATTSEAGRTPTF